MRPAAKATAGLLGAGFLALIVIALQHPAPRHLHAHAAPRPRPAITAASGPSAVVKAAFTAINRHDWPALWRLWRHRAPGRGLAYGEMIAGYRLTTRDVITSLHTPGDTVSAHVLAHETNGTVRACQFRYKVHADKITWGQ
jgi:hypothetical protein